MHVPRMGEGKLSAALVVYALIGVGYVSWQRWRDREHFRRAKQRVTDLFDGDRAGLPVSQGRLYTEAFVQFIWAFWIVLWPLGVALDIRDARRRSGGRHDG